MAGRGCTELQPADPHIHSGKKNEAKHKTRPRYLFDRVTDVHGPLLLRMLRILAMSR